MQKRKTLPTDTKTLVLHECGYRCANPACRMVLTLEIHHLEQVADGGSNDPSNLLPLCPNCHTLHHTHVIPLSSLRAWKHLLLALNQAFDTRLVDLLLTMHKLERVWLSGDGVLQCASGIASGLITVESRVNADNYFVCLTEKGKRFVSAWEAGNEQAAIGAA
jgi:HNH endonuclease